MCDMRWHPFQEPKLKGQVRAFITQANDVSQGHGHSLNVAMQSDGL